MLVYVHVLQVFKILLMLVASSGLGWPVTVWGLVYWILHHEALSY